MMKRPVQQLRRSSGIYPLSLVLFLLPAATLGVVTKEASSRNNHEKVPDQRLVDNVPGPLISLSDMENTASPKWLHMNESTGGLPPRTPGNLGPSFLTKIIAWPMVLDSWLSRGHRLARHMVSRLRLFPQARSPALLQTMSGQPPASEPDTVIIGQGQNGGAGERTETRLQAFLTMLISSLITLAFALFYWRQRKPPERQLDAVLDETSFKNWKFGLFDCFSDPEICLWACCCPAIRWADTMRYMGLLGFWIAFAIFFGLEVGASTTGEILIWAVLAVVCAGMRQEMRMAYGMNEQGGWTYLEDFCLYCCCACCTIIQEARQVEEAYKVGYPIAVRPSWNQGATPSAAHVQGFPAQQSPANGVQERVGDDQP